MGSVFPQQAFQAKVGYPFEVQFIPNESNYFINNPETIFKAVSRITEESRADCVEFSVEKQSLEDQKNNLYRIKVKVIKYADDIQIQPDCIEYPRVVSIGPDFVSSGVPANTRIEIQFNMSLQDEVALGNNSSINYDNIQLFYNGFDMRDYFESPVFNKDYTIISLIPKSPELISYIGEKAFIELSVTFGENITIRSGETDLPFIQNSKSNFKIRYKPEKENDPPRRNELIVSRNQITAGDALSLAENNRFTIAKIDAMDHDDYIKNRTNGTIYIYGTYYDGGSRVASVTLKETQTNDLQGFDIEKDKQIEIDAGPFNAHSEGIEFFDDETGNTIFCMPYKLKSENGAVLVQLTVNDFAGNGVTESFLVIKRDFLNLEIAHTDTGGEYENVSLSNSGYITFNPELELEFDEDVYKNALRTITLIANDGNYKDNFVHLYDWDTLDEEQLRNFSITCEYTNAAGTLVSKKFDYVSERTWRTNLEDVAKLSGSTLKIIAKDDIGNAAERIFSFPKSENIVCRIEEELLYSEYLHKYVHFITTEGDGKQITSGVQIAEDSNGVKTVKHYGNGYTGTEEIDNGYTFQIIPRVRDSEGNDFYVEIPDFTYSFNTTLGNPPQVELKNSYDNSTKFYSIANSSRKGYLDITVSIADDSWENFDCIYLKTSQSDNEPAWFFEAGEPPTCTFRVDTLQAYSTGINFWLYGIKQNALSESDKKTIPLVTGTEFDDVDPFIQSPEVGDALGRPDWENAIVSIADYESGPNGGIITIPGFKKKYTEYAVSPKNYYGTIHSFTIPVREVDKKKPAFTINYTFYDKAENFISGVLDFPINVLPDISSITKSSTTWNLKTKKTSSSLNCRDSSVIVEELNTNGEWTSYNSEQSLSITQTGNSAEGYVYEINGIDLPSDSIVRVVYKDYAGSIGYGYSVPFYLYTGTPCSGDYEYIQPSASNPNQILIYSDAPAFVHTLVTCKSYDECKDWSVEDWEFYHDHIGDKYLGFNSTNYLLPKSYDFPVDQIESGCCYCAVVHFANGKTAKSVVFQK